MVLRPGKLPGVQVGVIAGDHLHLARRLLWGVRRERNDDKYEGEARWEAHGKVAAGEAANVRRNSSRVDSR